MNQARGTYRHRAFSIIYGLENTTTLTPFCKKDRTKGTTGRQISKAKPTQGLSCKKKKEKGRWKRFEIPIGHQMTLGGRGLSTLGKEQDEDRFERSLAL